MGGKLCGPKCNRDESERRAWRLGQALSYVLTRLSLALSKLWSLLSSINMLRIRWDIQMVARRGIISRSLSLKLSSPRVFRPTWRSEGARCKICFGVCSNRASWTSHSGCLKLCNPICRVEVGKRMRISSPSGLVPGARADRESSISFNLCRSTDRWNPFSSSGLAWNRRHGSLVLAIWGSKLREVHREDEKLLP